jgi:simple sugar transport system substrate-binding protein
MRRALARAALALLVLTVAGGCGEATEVREPDLVTRGAPSSSTMPPQAAGGGATGDTRVRIAVVTHGAASSTFWSVIRNGIEAAARQSNVTFTYRSPDVYNVDRMARLIDEAVDSDPDGLIVSIPSPELLPAIDRATAAGIPVVSINSGSDLYERAGAIAHIGQPEDRAGLAAGERLARAGVRSGLCVNQEVGNAGLDLRCAGFARAMRAAGGRARVLAVDTKRLQETRDRIASTIAEHDIDGVLALNNAGGEAALAVAPVHVTLGTFDMTPVILQAVRRGRMRFAIDQQPYLQGYLPVVFLAELERHGIFPAQGDVIPTGPNFVTKETAEQAIRLSEQGIR